MVHTRPHFLRTTSANRGFISMLTTTATTATDRILSIAREDIIISRRTSDCARGEDTSHDSARADTVFSLVNDWMPGLMVGQVRAGFVPSVFPRRRRHRRRRLPVRRRTFWGRNRRVIRRRVLRFFLLQTCRGHEGAALVTDHFNTSVYFFVIRAKQTRYTVYV